MKHKRSLNLWTRLGCILTGYNYMLLKNCSEASFRSLRRTTSALMIICLIWGTVGYGFAKMYLELSVYTSIITSITMVFLVIQIERQVILKSNRSNWLSFFRVCIGILMAIIGAVIVDQVIFQEDIEIAKEKLVLEKVNENLPIKTQQINREISRIDSILIDLNVEKSECDKNIALKPMIKMSDYESVKRHKIIPYFTKDSLGRDVRREKDTIVTEMTVNSRSIPNPAIARRSGIQNQIDAVNKQRIAYTQKLSIVREELELKYEKQKGFMEELDIMYGIVTESSLAFSVWFLWFLFLLLMELLVLISQHSETDYDKLIEHQMRVRINNINKLGHGLE